MAVLMLDLAMRATRTAGLGARPERLIDDRLQGTRTTAAFGAAAQAAVELLGISGQIPGRLNGAADIIVAQDVTGTNDHVAGKPISDADPRNIEEGCTMQKEKPAFEAIPK
jgi:hypothetical protein